MEGLSASDVALLSDNRRDGGFMGDDMWGFLMFALIFGGGWGGFGFGNRGGSDVATKTDVSSGFALNALNNGIDSIKTGQFGLEASLANSTARIEAGLAQLGYQNQQCCCELGSKIQEVNYNMAINTGNITNAIKDSTQAILGYLTNEKIQSLQTELQSAQLALQNNAQTQTIINTLRPVAQPAYITCSPYEAANVYSHYHNNGCVSGACGF